MKKTRHSLIALLLVLVMIVSMFAACGKKTSENEENEGSSSKSPEQGDTPVYAKGSALVVNYLRVRELKSGSATLRFNTNYSDADLDIRYSDSEITEDNFKDAKEITNVSISRNNGYIDLEIKDISVGDDPIYVAVQAKDEDYLSNIGTVRVGGIVPIEVDSEQIYAGDVIRDFSKLFDEQSIVGDPFNGNGKRLPSSAVPRFGWDADPSKKIEANIIETMNKNSAGNYLLSPVVDLRYLHYIECVYVYYGANAYELTVRSSKNAANFDKASEWDDVQNITPGERKWTKIDIGEKVQYLQFLFEDGQAPTEILIYGYSVAEGEVEVSTKVRQIPKISEFMGICGLVNSGVADFLPTNFVREYHNLGWSYKFDKFPKAAFTDGSPHGKTKEHYGNWLANGIKAIPCIQWTRTDDVAKFIKSDGKLDLENKTTNLDKFDPEVYASYADLAFQYAARFGHTSTDSLIAIHQVHSTESKALVSASTGAGLIDWIELGNEPNGEDDAGYSAYQLAALQTAAYDGHMKTLLSSTYGANDYFLGAKNADPTIKLAMAGLAGIGTNYIEAMCFWMRANRTGFEPGTNDSIAMDAFNVHSYFARSFIMNGQTIQASVSPEEFGLIDHLAGLIEYRNKYYPDCEVWITEFGWDTNQSYLTKTACHAYGEYSGWEVQAMWLTRAYLLLSASGVDKAAMYMALDETTDESLATNMQYGSCGIITKSGVKKNSYYSLYTLKSTLNDYRFNKEINSGNKDVWVYQYKTDDGKTAYALWCPTSDGTKVEGFQLNIGASSAILIQNEYGKTEGKRTPLAAKSGVVTVNVSEDPIYIVVND